MGFNHFFVSTWNTIKKKNCKHVVRRSVYYKTLGWKIAFSSHFLLIPMNPEKNGTSSPPAMQSSIFCVPRFLICFSVCMVNTEWCRSLFPNSFLLIIHRTLLKSPLTWLESNLVVVDLVHRCATQESAAHVPGRVNSAWLTRIIQPWTTEWVMLTLWVGSTFS